MRFFCRPGARRVGALPAWRRNAKEGPSQDDDPAVARSAWLDGLVARSILRRDKGGERRKALLSACFRAHHGPYAGGVHDKRPALPCAEGLPRVQIRVDGREN